MKQLIIIITILFSLSGKGQVIGFNANIVNGGRLVTFENLQLVDSIATLHAKEFRIPGGGSAGTWEWKTMKPSLASLINLRTRILFCLNINHTLADQLQMLDSASRLGLQFDCEMGNEISNANNPALKKFHYNGAEYGRQCKIWSDAIHARFPGAKVGVWGESKTELPDWTSQLLSIYTPDALVSHVYPSSNTVCTDSIVDSAKLFKRLDNAFALANIDFSIPVWITEYNINPDSLGGFKRGQHRKALILMTNYFINKGVQLMCMSNLYGSREGAWYMNSFGVPKIRLEGRAFLKLMK